MKNGKVVCRIKPNHRIFNEIYGKQKVEDMPISFISQLIFYDYDIVKTKNEIVILCKKSGVRVDSVFSKKNFKDEHYDSVQSFNERFCELFDYNKSTLASKLPKKGRLSTNEYIEKYKVFYVDLLRDRDIKIIKRLNSISSKSKDSKIVTFY